MTNPPAKPETVTKLALHMAWHVLIGTASFVLIAACAVGLHFVVEWMRHSGVAHWMADAAMFLEYGLFGMDALLFALFIARTGWSFFTTIAFAEVEP